MGAVRRPHVHPVIEHVASHRSSTGDQGKRRVLLIVRYAPTATKFRSAAK